MTFRDRLGWFLWFVGMLLAFVVLADELLTRPRGRLIFGLIVLGTLLVLLMRIWRAKNSGPTATRRR